MRSYYLLLVFATGSDAIVECDLDDDPNQIAREHHAPMYRKYATRADAERWMLIPERAAGATEPGRIVAHTPGTAHFRCACGEHLVFSSQSRSLTVLVDLQEDGGAKIGACPKCARLHTTRHFTRT